jgi:WD40 repeat protein
MSLATSVFGKGGKYYLSISLDNRIKLIDVQTGTEKHSFVEKHHLSHSYTCCSWGQKNKDDLGHFAVGSSDGMIIVWDLTRGVSKSIGKANEFPVPTDVRLSRDMKCVFVSSSASHIVEYEIATGTQKRSFKSSKKGSQRLCMNPVVDAFAFAR